MWLDEHDIDWASRLAFPILEHWHRENLCKVNLWFPTRLCSIASKDLHKLNKPWHINESHQLHRAEAFFAELKHIVG